jgi:hypothetical protein
LVILVVAALLVFTSGASAGPPAKLCRHISAHQCEQDLGPYAAAQFLRAYVINKLRPRLTAPSGGTLYCGHAQHYRPWVFRCGTTIEGGGLLSPCKVEAIIARNKLKVFRFDWLEESASCSA